MSGEQLWVVIGFVAQAQFGARVIVQWIASERRRSSVVPVAYWYFSVGGGVMLLAYAIHRLDPVFILGESFTLIVFIRNLFLIHATRRAQ